MNIKLQIIYVHILEGFHSRLYSVHPEHTKTVIIVLYRIISIFSLNKYLKYHLMLIGVLFFRMKGMLPSTCIILM